MLKKHAQMLLYALICVAGTVTAYSFFATHKTPQNVIIRYDEHLSPDAQIFMSRIINQALAEGKKARAIRSDLVHHAPSVSCVTISRRQPGRVHVLVKAERPHVLVTHLPSTHWVLSHQGNFAPYNQYSDPARAGLPRILIDSEMFSEHDKQELYRWIQQTLKSCNTFFECYNVTWLKATNILLQDKNDPNFYVATTTKTQLTPQLQEKINQTYQRVLAQRTTKKWNKKLWKADIRFQDQIVLSPLKNGKGLRK